MKRVKKGDPVTNTFLLGNPKGIVRSVEGSSIFVNHYDRKGAKYSIYDSSPFHKSWIFPRKPKKGRAK